MNCQTCGERPASVHLTQIVNNQVTTQHLCDRCAEEKGVETSSTVAKFPLSDFLASMGSGSKVDDPETQSAVKCGSCGSTIQDFRETGRLGCPGCYDAFRGHLKDLLRRLHGATRHVGSPYFGQTEEDSSVPSIFDLRQQLDRAVEREDFELAARLRDQIRGLE